MTSSLALLPNTLGSAYPIHLPAFQGPLDLLLQLIEKEELEISEVSLVAVTDSYLKTIEQLAEIEPGALADFLMIASRLLYLKSRSLLPQPRPTDEEDEDDTADALLRQLLEYRQFKAIAEQLKARADLGLRAYVRTEPGPKPEKRLDLSTLDLNRLQSALRKVLQRIPTDPPMPTVKTYPITLAQQIENVRRLVAELQNGKGTINFSELLSRGRSRTEVIVTFLAVLELIKREEVTALQDEPFGEIVLQPVLR